MFFIFMILECFVFSFVNELVKQGFVDFLFNLVRDQFY